MLKKRIVATVVVHQGCAVQSIGFARYLPIGKPEIAVEYLSRWGIDEIVLIDIDATREQRLFDIQLLKKISRKCFVPLTVGGGIQSVDDVKFLLNNGADKISVNHLLRKSPNSVKMISEYFGKQCVVGSIDHSGNYVHDYYTQKKTSVNVLHCVDQAILNGVGEILLTSTDRNGLKTGFDYEVASQVVQMSSVPVILSGGAGNHLHIIQAFEKANPAAVACGNYLHYTEHSVVHIKSLIERSSTNIPIRLESKISYRNGAFDDNQRLLKKSEDELEKLLYKKIEKEVI